VQLNFVFFSLSYSTPASEHSRLEDGGKCQNVCATANWVQLPCGGTNANAQTF
jgi:hypothetical protein